MTSLHSHLWPGVPLALASAALFGASTPFAKLLLGAVDAWLLAGLLYLGAGLGLALVQLARGALRLPAVEAPLRRADLPWLAAVVVAGGIVGPLLLMLGLARTDAASGALLLNLEGLATMALAWLGLPRERRPAPAHRRTGHSRRGGAAVLAGPRRRPRPRRAADRRCLPRLGHRQQPDPQAVLGRPGADRAGQGPDRRHRQPALALLQGAALPGAGTVLAAGLVGFLGYGVSLVLFVLALRHLGAARTGAYFALAPFIGALLAILLLGDPLSLRLLFAGGLMAVGLWLHLAERHEHDHTHEPQEHEHRHRHDEHHRHAHGPNDPAGEPHTHRHRHGPLPHRHPHYPDLHHRHAHR